MKHFPGAFSDDKVEETFNSFSVKFNTPFVFLDPSGEEMFSVSPEGTGQPNTAGSFQYSEVPAVPVRYLGDVIGSLAVPRELPRDREIAASAAYCLEIVLRLEADLEDLSSEIVRLYEELALTYSLSRKLGSEMDVETICQLALEEADKKLSAENVFIMLLEGTSDLLRTRCCIGSDMESAQNFTADCSSEFIGQVLRLREPVTSLQY
jgi:hypothetical protein